MHAWYKKYGMICHAQKYLINHALLPKYAQWSFEDKRQKEKHLSNPSPHILCKFSHRVTLSRLSFIQTSIFHKNFSLFLIIFNMVYFFNSFLFQTCQFSFSITQKYFFWSFSTQYIYFFNNSFLFQHVIFFTTFHLTLNKVFFFRKKRIRHSFFHLFIFLFKIIHHSISEKKQNEKPCFLYFSFRNSEHTFWQIKKNFLNPNDSHEIY